MSKKIGDKKSWNIDAQYRRYLKVVDKYEQEHVTFKIDRYSKKEFKKKMNYLKNELEMTKVDYKRDIVERQVYSELDKKAARKLKKAIEKEIGLKGETISKLSVEQLGQRGVHHLSAKQKEMLTDVLASKYHKLKEEGLSSHKASKYHELKEEGLSSHEASKYQELKEKGLSSHEASKYISHYYFGSPE